jgi:16S rRNA (guanine527-N7)-methyltransferase
MEEEASRQQLVLSPSVACQLVAFIELLGRWGQQINLTSQPDPRSLIQGHLPDAFVLSAALSPHALSHAVDVGSGGGLPGVALAILCPQLYVTLVEPRTRRAAFLRTVVHTLKLNAAVVPQRVEHLSLPPQDLAFSRATFPPAEWLHLARPLITRDGLVAVFATHVEDLPAADTFDQRTQISYTIVSGAPRVLALYQPVVSRETAR